MNRREVIQTTMTAAAALVLPKELLSSNRKQTPKEMPLNVPPMQCIPPVHPIASPQVDLLQQPTKPKEEFKLNAFYSDSKHLYFVFDDGTGKQYGAAGLVPLTNPENIMAMPIEIIRQTCHCIGTPELLSVIFDLQMTRELEQNPENLFLFNAREILRNKM